MNEQIPEECYACLVGVATGPESHSEGCAARDIPMPVQDGQWGPEWTEYDRRVAVARIMRDHHDVSLADAVRIAVAVRKVARRKAERARDGGQDR